MGRPPKLNQVIAILEDGTKVTVRQRIIEWTRAGYPNDVVMAKAGLSTAIMHYWIRTAARAEQHQAIDSAYRPTKAERDLIEFSRQVEAARADSEASRWDAMGKLADGFEQTKRVRRTLPSGRIELTDTVEKQAPSFQANRYILEAGFGRRVPIDVNLRGSALDPEELDDTLADSLERFLALDPAHDDAVIEANGHETNGHQ